MKGYIIYEWNDGSMIRIPTQLDEESGKLTSISVEVTTIQFTLKGEVLEGKPYFLSLENYNIGERYIICPTCKDYILKNVDGETVCSNPDCDYNKKAH